MAEKVFVNGIRVFKPRDNAPDFVIADLVIKRDDLIDFLKTQNYEFKAVIKKGNKGYYMEVNTYGQQNIQADAAKQQSLNDGFNKQNLNTQQSFQETIDDLPF